jgi:glutathione S-transferase
MAARISLYEAGASAEFVYVDIHTSPQRRQLPDGSDYFAINPMGQVPAILTSDGKLISENPVVLQYIADQHPQAGLAPQDVMERYRLQQWLNFVATELHKATFIPLLIRDSPDGAKAFARQKLALRFGYLEKSLSGRSFLLEGFTVADAYLVTVLNWAPYAGIELSQWPQVQAYFQRLSQRPSVAKAMAEEAKLYAEHRARQ